jgi:Ca2+-dependent lipid-binding protein
MLDIPLDRVEQDPRWPNVLEVQVVRARNLLAMDSNGLSDPYAHVTVRGAKHTTQTKFMTLNPMWKNELFKFHITDPSAVLHVELWDRDMGGLQSAAQTHARLCASQACRATSWGSGS